MKPPVYLLTLTRWEHLFTTIVVREQGNRTPIEFRGDGIWQWGLGVPACSRDQYLEQQTWIRSHGQRICWAEWLHDGLKGWHTCVLYTGDTLAILPHHPDYQHVADLVRFSQLPEVEVIRSITP